MSKPITQDDLFSIMQSYEDRLNAIMLALKNTVPVGGIIIWTAAAIPEGWLQCNGQEVGRAIYPNLWNTIGTRFGSPSTGSVFKVPTLAAPGTNMVYIIKT